MDPFVMNRHGRIVFPCNFFPTLDFSVFENLEQFTAVITRDFGEKSPTEHTITDRLKAGKYQDRYTLCRDLALNLFWVNRYDFTMYEKRPIRWGDLPRHRDDVFLPLCRSWDSPGTVEGIEAGYQALPVKWDEEIEDEAFRMLLRSFRAKPVAGSDLRAIKPTVAEMLANPRHRTVCLTKYDPDYPGFSYDDVIDYSHPVPELEAVMRQAMILHNQYRWDPVGSCCVEVGKLQDDDFVVALYPRNNEVLQFIKRVRRNEKPRSFRSQLPRTLALTRPIAPYEPINVRKQFSVMPKIEGVAVYEGEIACTNADLIRNHAYCWSRMTEPEIAVKTGIEKRCYSELNLEHMALLAARAALKQAKRKPSEIGAVLFCSCTTARLLPSTACWLSGELGIMQTHCSCDIISACAGMPYGFSEAVRILQEVKRPVLIVLAEKFSDKIGTVRTSRMIFGDGAAACVIAPAPEGAEPDIEYLQSYAGGPWSEVNSIIWPNPEFGNAVTVYGPEVKSLAQRYLIQMMEELKELEHPTDSSRALIDAVDLVVPHQANKTMVENLAENAGVPADRLYFNIERVGNTSAASILMAVKDAVVDKRIDRPMRIFAPGFGAGAVGGYVVFKLDPAVVNVESQPKVAEEEEDHKLPLAGRVALVTGASRGIGRAIALELAHRGASVAINFRSDAGNAQAVAQEIRDLGVGCVVIQGDVSQRCEAQRVVNEVLDKWQRLDILVNNAGITRDRSLRKMTDEDWERVIDVNLNGTFHTTSAALPAMINQRFGRIINISSVVGQSGAFGQANYSASKGGVIAFTKTVALETAKYNITANAIAPGYTSTDMVAAIPEEVASRIKAGIPMGRFATPEEVAKAAAFLAAEADYITGQELNVNGGCYM